MEHPQAQLHEVAIALGTIGSFQSNKGSQLLVLPDEVSLVSFFGLLEHKAQPGIIALVLDAGVAASSAFEADPPGFAQADPVEGVIGSSSKGLRHHRVQVLRQPADP